MSPNISSSGIQFWYTMTIDLITNTGKCLWISPVDVVISDTQWQLISSLIQTNVSKYLQFRYPFLIHNDNWSHHQYREMSPNISSSGIHFWYTMTIDLITNTGKCLQISPVQVSISDTQWQLISSPIQGNVSKYLHFRYPFLLHNDRWSHITNTGKYKEWKNRCQKTWWDTCWWTDDDWLCCSAETKQVRKTGNTMWIMETKLLLSLSLSLQLILPQEEEQNLKDRTHYEHLQQKIAEGKLEIKHTINKYKKANLRLKHTIKKYKKRKQKANLKWNVLTTNTRKDNTS